MRTLKYEIKNSLGNPSNIIFGILMPIFMGILISNGVVSDFPENLRGLVGTSVILSISTIIPLAVCLLGYGAVYSQEVENNIPMRISLFGIREGDQLKGKVLAHFFIITVGGILYFTVMKLTLPFFESPSGWGILKITVIQILLAGVFVVIAHSVSNILKKFGPTFGILMGLYFFLMLIGGMMGPTYDMFPQWLKKISLLSPITVFGRDAYTIWKNGSYNWGPFIQSYLFFSAIAAIIFILSVRKNNRNKLK